MSKTFIDKACAVVPNLENRISLFHKKLRLAQYAEHSIYDYKLKIAQAALYLQKLPDDFTQDDVEGYLSSLLDQKQIDTYLSTHIYEGSDSVLHESMTCLPEVGNINNPLSFPILVLN